MCEGIYTTYEGLDGLRFITGCLVQVLKCVCRGISD
jgi:hypothetical protein